MEVAKAISNVTKLVRESACDISNKSDTNKPKSIDAGVFGDVFKQFSAGHPIRDQPELLELLGDGDSQEGDNVWVYHAFPHHGLSAEIL